MKLGDFLRGTPRSGRIRFFAKPWEQPTYKSKRPPWWTLSVKEGHLKIFKWVRGGEIWLEEFIRLEGSMHLVPDLETEGWVKHSRYGYDTFFCTSYPLKRGGRRGAP